MAKFKIQKEPLQPHFLGLNVEAVGEAAERLKHCGLKMYLYLMSNSDGFVWNMNPTAFANWLGVDYSNQSMSRKVRKTISDGTEDLKVNGYLKEIGKDSYIISEQIVPEWLDSTLGTKSSDEDAEKEQIVPKKLVSKESSSEQFVPDDHSSILGTNCSSVEAEKERKVPNCYGF